MGVKKRVSRKSEVFIAMVATLVLASILCFGIGLGVSNNNNSQQDSPVGPSAPVEPDEPDPAEEPEILKIDFQPVIDSWVKTVGGNKSVLVYDVALDEIVGSYNPEESYNTASLYKLFVVYEGYKRVNTGEWDGNAKAGYTGKTILECLDLAIRESNSECAETLWGMIGRNALANIIESEWKITNSNIPKLISNPNDIMLIMKRFYEHPDFDNETLLDKMWDSFLNQPVTKYDWRMGLPKGFSKASVYNKVGWDFDPDVNVWNIYHDAAIVKFPLEDGMTRDYIVVVMTNKVDHKSIRKLGTNLENKFYEEIKI